MVNVEITSVTREDIEKLFTQGIILKQCITCDDDIINPSQIAGLKMKDEKIHPICMKHQGDVWEESGKIIQ